MWENKWIGNEIKFCTLTTFYFTKVRKGAKK